MIKNKGCMYKKGFTLIELLIVIAIIGILASITMVSLTGIQKKSKDNAATISMNQIRIGAEMDYNKNNSFNNICPSSSSGNGRFDTKGLGDSISGNPVLTAIKDAQNALGSSAISNSTVAGYIDCKNSDTAYAVIITLNTGFYCVDSNNFAGKRTSATLILSPTISCPTS